jgi:hypothetical protein
MTQSRRYGPQTGHRYTTIDFASFDITLIILLHLVFKKNNYSNTLLYSFPSALARYLQVLRLTERSVSSRLENIGVPSSFALDVVWKCGDKLFLPIRLIEYNMLGIFGVIAWIGMEFILLAIASKHPVRVAL